MNIIPQIENLIQKTELGKIQWEFKSPTVFETFMPGNGNIKYQFILSGTPGIESITFQVDLDNLIVDNGEEKEKI